MNAPADRPGRERTYHRLVRAAEEEIEATLRALPPPLRKEARQIPVTLEPFPNQAILDDGFEPDLLGLFVGRARPDEMVSTEELPTQILLFVENLWDYAGHDPEIYREEVRRTLLHELGHYLGLDEDELFERDVD